MTATKEPKSTETMDDIDRAAVAKKHGVTRAAVHNRIARGWTREEIEQGHRDRKDEGGKSAYKTRYTEALGGYSADVVAKFNNLSVAGLYDRLRNDRPIRLPSDPETPE